MKIEKTSFGSITIDAKEYTHDVIISANQQIQKRDKSRSARIQGHRELAKVEIDELLEDSPEMIIIGRGQYGKLPLSEKTNQYLNQQVTKMEINLIMNTTPIVISDFNQLISKHRISALFHVTC